MKYIYLTLLLVIGLNFSVSAENSDIEMTFDGYEIPKTWRVEGIDYKVIDEDAHKVSIINMLTLVHGNWGYCYEIQVPATVVHDGIEYTLEGVEVNTFNTAVSVELPDCIRFIERSNFYKFGDLWNGETVFRFPEQLERIYGHCFNETKLSSIKLPPHLLSIDADSFNGNELLNTLEFGNCLKRIDENCFNSNDNVKEIYLPNSLERIGDNCFNDCQSLEKIRLPRYLPFWEGTPSMKTFVSIFNNCPNIKVIEWESRTPVAMPNSFNALDKSICTVIVPDGCKSAYEENDYWKEFIIVEKSDYEAGVQIAADPEQSEEAYYTLTGFRIHSKENLEKGMIYLKVAPEGISKFMNIY